MLAIFISLDASLCLGSLKGSVLDLNDIQRSPIPEEERDGSTKDETPGQKTSLITVFIPNMLY